MSFYTLRPISDRSTFTGDHKPIPFKATWSDTLTLLRYELAELEADRVVLEVDVLDGDIRRDGMLSARAKVASPGVRLAFDSRHGPLTYATDRFKASWTGQMPDWQANVRAIALSLEALRKVDRYGITKRGEQYTGWQAITTGRPQPMSWREAESILGQWSGEAAWLDTETPRVVRRARAATHPDRNGGDHTAYDLVDQAAQVLALGAHQ